MRLCLCKLTNKSNTSFPFFPGQIRVGPRQGVHEPAEGDPGPRPQEAPRQGGRQEVHHIRTLEARGQEDPG